MMLSPSNIKKVFINADDFAQSAAIDDAIIDLAERRIIHSTSALVLSPHWKTAANKLASLPIQAGLHLDLSSHFTPEFGSYHKLPQLITASYSSLLDIKYLQNTIQLQWDRFTESMGRTPDFIDGHQHIHQLPIIRDALFSIIAKENWGLQAENWLRISQAKSWRGFKAQLINTLGAKKTQRLANEYGITTNSDFAGVYDFDPHNDLRALWGNWLNTLQGSFPLIMCHVAKNQHSNLADKQDTIYQARLREYQWLSSPEFETLLQSKGYTI